ncbi:unnamed protein product [Effrenium voratum]|nr:unnamed protein product [Effrenium voratum]
MAAYDRLWGGYDWSWLRGGEWFAEEGHEIRLAQSPQFVLGARGHQVVVLESGGSAGSEWLVKPNGLIVLAAEPDLALSVEGTEVTAGCNIILRKHSGKAEYFNKWTWNSDGTIRLADMPSYDLNVKNGKVANGAAVIIWENRQPLAHNVWTSPAKSASSSSSAAETFRLKVVDTRSGDPNTLWSSITGGVEVQTGYLAVSQAKNRDKKSSWAYIHEDYYHPDIVTFVKEHHGTTFLLKAINKAHKVLGYLSCAESLELDRRDGVSSYSYAHLDKSHATTFREEPCKDGFVLKTIDCVGAGGRQHHGHLCPIRFKDRPQDFGEDFTWLYVETETPNFAAVFVAQPVKGKGQEHPWWSDLVGKYYYVLIGCCCFVCIAVIAAIVAALTGGQAGMTDVPSDRPLQINVPYHCEHELISMWSRAKSAWCCEHYEKGCLTTTAATGPAAAPLVPWEQQPPKTADDDCFTDVLNWSSETGRSVSRTFAVNTTASAASPL